MEAHRLTKNTNKESTLHNIYENILTAKNISTMYINYIVGK